MKYTIASATKFLNSLDAESYINIMVAAKRRRPRNLRVGDIVCVAGTDGLGYGVVLGGGQTIKVWRVGDSRFSYYKAEWTCIVQTNQRIKLDKSGLPSEKDVKALNKKYAK